MTAPFCKPEVPIAIIKEMEGLEIYPQGPSCAYITS
jgi:hypothetical protein